MSIHHKLSVDIYSVCIDNMLQLPNIKSFKLKVTKYINDYKVVNILLYILCKHDIIIS